MPMYKAKVDCFVGNAYRRADDIFEYNGPKNTNIELVSGAAQADEDDEAPAPKSKRASKASAEA